MSSGEGIKLEVPFGPWEAWGQPIFAYANAQVIPPDRDITYSAWVRITKNPVGADRLRDPTSPESYIDGDSNLELPKDRELAITLGGWPNVMVILRPNTEGRLGYLEVSSFRAQNIHDALQFIRQSASALSLVTSMTTKIPINWDGILVRSDDKLEIRMDSKNPYPTILADQLRTIWVQDSLLRFTRLFAEGLRSESPFYRFLSFFKVAQRINSSVRPQLRKLCEKNGVQAPTLNGTLPQGPIELFDRTLIGKKYSSVVMDYQSLYRNAIAHLDATEKILPFDFDAEHQVCKAAMVLSYIVNDLLQQLALTIESLRSAGLSDSDIRFG